MSALTELPLFWPIVIGFTLGCMVWALPLAYIWIWVGHQLRVKQR